MPNQKPHSQHDVVESSPATSLLWGFVLALLTFLIVIICITSIRLITREAENALLDNPTEPTEPTDPTDPTDPVAPSAPVVPDTPTEPEQPETPTAPDPQTSYLLQKTGSTVEEVIREGDALTGVYSTNAVFVDAASRTVLAGLAIDDQIAPASMTKVMTLLVACERLEASDYDSQIVISAEVVAAMQRENASGFGFQAGEKVTVRDLLYAIAVESDCVASIEIATFVAGSHEAFVQMMNAKCNELGLMNTHFVNATGLDAANHYTTCREMASIMVAAMENEQVATFLGEDTHVTSTELGGTTRRVTFFNTYYIDVMERGSGSYYDLTQVDTGARVIGAKTGSTDVAGKCFVSCVRSSSGKTYVSVTAGAISSVAYCADLLYMYQTYAK